MEEKTSPVDEISNALRYKEVAGGRYGYHFCEILKDYFQSGHQDTCNHSCRAQNEIT
jgi:hypothetical protein